MKVKLLKKLRKDFRKDYTIIQTDDSYYPVKVIKPGSILYAYHNVDCAKKGIDERIEDDIRYYIKVKRGKIKIIK